MSNKKIYPTDSQKEKAEAQIRDQQKETRYDLRDFTIDYIVQEYRQGLFFIPNYQRKFIWKVQHRVDFIESVLLGLPIPMMFVADLEDGRLEIVDGAQRIQTIEQFLNNDLKLRKLSILTSLENFCFDDLSTAQKRKFQTKALRFVVLEDSTSEKRRQEIFNRINTRSETARPSEIRRGDYDSPLMKFVIKCTKNEIFQKICPVSEKLAARREREELVLRFFAYSNSYKSFKHDVSKFLDKFLLDNRDDFDIAQYEKEFNLTMRFVEKHFPTGFAKTKTAKTTPRVRFEAIAVGTNLALREDHLISPVNMDWLESDDFTKHVTTHASNSGPKLRGRVEFVKDQLLEDSL